MKRSGKDTGHKEVADLDDLDNLKKDHHCDL